MEIVLVKRSRVLPGCVKHGTCKEVLFLYWQRIVSRMDPFKERDILCTLLLSAKLYGGAELNLILINTGNTRKSTTNAKDLHCQSQRGWVLTS